MTDIVAVRNEIKTWERNFRSENGRDPSIQDIKDRPSIAQKYKLYKKLSKTAPTLAVISKQRSIEPTTPLSSFNPFSPVKNKKVEEGSRSNSFTTPVKRKSSPADERKSSPDPFPAIPSQVPISNFRLPSFATTNALSRARKRLRGEPVSPSPIKDKRRRVSPTSLPFTSTNSPLPSSGDEDDPHVGEANSSFVNDSPIKAPSGGKPFRLLFEEVVPPNTKSNNTKKTISKTTSSLFGSDPNKNRMNATNSTVLDDRKEKVTNRKHDIPSGSLPIKDDLFSDNRISRKDAAPGSSGSLPAPRTSAKRPLPNTELGHNESVTISQPLLPPSPPPTDIYTRAPAKYKGKEVVNGRKKAKVENDIDSEGDNDSEEGSNVKVVSHSHRPQSEHVQDDQELDLGPILRFRAHRRPHGTPALVDQPDDMSKFEVDLPDRIRSVLAISPSKPRDLKEERVVRGLLYGGRASHYDPVKGGEIWDAGEIDDEGRGGNTEGEDDWEGEPVPWEVGEL